MRHVRKAIGFGARGALGTRLHVDTSQFKVVKVSVGFRYIISMAHRLTAHHRAFFSPKYFSGTVSHITTTSVHRAPFDVKDENDFKERVLKSSKPVIVDFHAEWCRPCKVLGPKLDAVVGEKDGKIELAKVDIDQMADLAVQFGVGAVPTVLGVKDGKVVDQFVGDADNTKIKSFVDQLL